MSAGRLGAWLGRAAVAGAIGVVIAVSAGGLAAALSDVPERSTPTEVAGATGGRTSSGPVVSPDDYTWN